MPHSGANLGGRFSPEAEFPPEKSLGIVFSRPTFHASQPGQSTKYLRIEPLLGTLRAEMLNQKVDFALQHSCSHRHVDIGSAYVSIPLRNFVFENAVIAKSIPRQTADKTMILMGIITAMGQNQIWIDAPFSVSNHDLIAPPAPGRNRPEKTSPRFAIAQLRQKIGCR